MLDPLVADLLHTGILQFGQFMSNSELAPFRFCPEYLPAYPQLLRQIADKAANELTEFNVDRIVTVEESVPFGVACAMQTGLSLAYAKSGGAFPVQNLIGAYDSGHRAALLVNDFDSAPSLTTFIADAHKVGLEINAIVAILTVGEEKIAGIPIHTLFRLEDILTQLSEADQLSTHQAHVVRTWMAERNQRQNH